MALAMYTGNELVGLFSQEVREKGMEIFSRIPGTLLKFLDEKKIIKKVIFKDDILAIGKIMGTERQKDLNNFKKSLRDSIKARFRQANVNEIQPEDFSEDITAHYRDQSKIWAKPGEKLSTIVRYTKEYQVKNLQHWTKVHAYVYIHIIEECENNWFGNNNYKFGYDLSIELSGLSIDTAKALKFSQLVAQGTVSDSIRAIEAQTTLTWNDL
ncbi:hypothetical protein I4U23_023904 [Adineta vaga]|nr:hypothetical protein I4U23_023904 [Adineta vaga]